MSKYYIEFNVAPDKKSIQTIIVDLDSEVVTDMTAPRNVGLVEHPLYPQLEKYVLNNPSIAPEQQTTSKH
jgi:hypothetical protein